MTEVQFNLGAILMSREVNDRVAEDEGFAKFVMSSLKRHANYDWGDICQEDWQENEWSLEEGYRILSSYNGANEKIWIITEADRSATTILFPEEY